MPRRTRSSTQTTAIRPPIKRTAPTEETPTLPLTPIEVESLVQGSQAPGVPPADAATRPTVETFRPALGSSPIPTVGQAALALAPATNPAPAPPTPAAARPASSAQIAPPPPASSPSSAAPSSRGPRRTREMFHRDAIRPPRKR